MHLINQAMQYYYTRRLHDIHRNSPIVNVHIIWYYTPFSIFCYISCTYYTLTGLFFKGLNLYSYYNMCIRNHFYSTKYFLSWFKKQEHQITHNFFCPFNLWARLTRVNQFCMPQMTKQNNAAAFAYCVKNLKI